METANGCARSSSKAPAGKSAAANLNELLQHSDSDTFRRTTSRLDAEQLAALAAQLAHVQKDDEEMVGPASLHRAVPRPQRLSTPSPTSSPRVEPRRAGRQTAPSPGASIERSDGATRPAVVGTSAQVLLGISEALNSDVAIDSLIQHVVTTLFRLFSCPVSYYIQQQQQQQSGAQAVTAHIQHDSRLVCRASSEGAWVGSEAPAHGVVSYVMKSGRSVNVPDVAADWRFDETARQRPQLGSDSAMLSALCVPVRSHDGRVVAVIEVLRSCSLRSHEGAAESTEDAPESSSGADDRPPVHDRRCSEHMRRARTLTALVSPPRKRSVDGNDAGSCADTFDSDDESLVGAVAVLISMAMTRQELSAKLQAQQKQICALDTIMDLTSAEVSMRQVIAKIAHAAAVVVQAECVVLYLVDEDNRELVSQPVSLLEGGLHASGTPGDLLSSTPVRVGATSSGTLLSPLPAEDGRVGRSGSSFSFSSSSSIPLCTAATPSATPTLTPTLTPTPLAEPYDSMVIALGQGITGHVALTGRVLNIADAGRDWRYDPILDRKLGLKTRSLLAVPITDYMGKTVGVIAAHNRINDDTQQASSYEVLLRDLEVSPPGGFSLRAQSAPYMGRTPSHPYSEPPPSHRRRPSRASQQLQQKPRVGLLHPNWPVTAERITTFSDTDVLLLSSLANTSASILRQAQLYDAEVRSQRKTEALLQITAMMSEEMGTEKVVPRIIDASYVLVDAERISFFMVEELPQLSGTDGADLPEELWRTHWDTASPIATGTEPVAAAAAPTTATEKPAVPGEPSGGRESGKRQSNRKTKVGVTFSEGESERERERDREQQLRRSLVRKSNMNGAVDSPASEHIDLQEERRVLVCRVSRDPEFEGHHIPWGSGIVGSVALSGKALIIPDAYRDPRFDRSHDQRTGFRTRSLLTVPVTDSEGRVLAVIQACNKLPSEHIGQIPRHDGSNAAMASTGAAGAPNALASPATGSDAANSHQRSGPRTSRRFASFNDEDARNLESLAASAGIILRKSQLYEAAVRAERRSRALVRLLQVTSSSMTNIVEIIEGIAQVAYDVLDADRVTVFFVDSDRRELYSIVSKDARGVTIPLSQGIAGYVAQKGQAVNVWDAPQLDKFDPNLDRKSRSRTKSVLCVPVKDHDGRTLCVIQAVNKRLKSAQERRHPSATHHSLSVEDSESFIPFSRDDQMLVEALAAQLKSCVRRFVTEATLERLSQQTENHVAISLIQLYATNRADAGVASSPGTQRPSQLQLVVGTPQNKVPTARLFRWPSDSPGGASGVEAVRKLDDTHFNVFSYNESDLLRFAAAIFEELGLIQRFSIPKECLQRWLVAVRSKYHDAVPFHNFTHGFSVFHMSYVFLKRTSEARSLTELEVLSLMVASLCHDIDHPGVTNSFEISSGSQRALVYNDRSVLENHHAFVTFSILRDDQLNILCGLQASEKAAARSAIVQGILATDMAEHFEMVAKLSCREAGQPFAAAEPRERQLLLNTILHSSDLSGQVFPAPIAQEWEKRISKEFQEQGAREERLGLPTLPFMQGLSDPVKRANLQVGFIEAFLLPLWSNVARLFPAMRCYHRTLLRNRNQYRKHAGMEKGKDEGDDNNDNDDNCDDAGDNGGTGTEKK